MLESRVKDSTYQAYQIALQACVFDLLGDDFYNYVCDVFTEETFAKIRNNLNNLNVSAKSKNYYRNRICGFYDFLVLMDQIDNGIILKQKALMPNYKDNGEIITKDNCWSEEEWNTFINSVPNDTPFKLAFEICYWCALRRGELMGLRFGDFNYEKNTLTISRQLNLWNKITSPKSAKSCGTISIPKFIIKKVKDLQEEYHANSTDTLFFPDKFCAYSVLSYTFDTYVQKVPNLKKITLHGLRHSMASRMIAHNVPIIAVSKYLRHNNPNITMQTYAHLLEKQNKNYADELFNEGVNLG